MQKTGNTTGKVLLGQASSSRVRVGITYRDYNVPPFLGLPATLTEQDGTAQRAFTRQKH